MTPNEEDRLKSSKPMMEKRRRARINDSLHQLKNLVLDALNKNNPRHSKLEKADILEMTVRYLRSMNQHRIAGMALNQDVMKLAEFRTGYAECMKEVSRYLSATTPNFSSNYDSDVTENTVSIINKTSNNDVCGGRMAHTSGSMIDKQMEVRLQLLSHLATQCSSTALDLQGTGSIPLVQGTPLAPGIISSKEVHSLPVHVGGTPVNESVNGTQRPLRRLVMDRVNDENELASRLPLSVAFRPKSSVSSGVPTISEGELTSHPPTTLPDLAPGAEGITLVLPQHFVQSGHFPTHLIPVYTGCPLINSVSPTQAPTSVSSNSARSSPTHVMPTSVAPSNLQPARPVGEATSAPFVITFPPHPSPSTHPHAGTTHPCHGSRSIQSHVDTHRRKRRRSLSPPSSSLSSSHSSSSFSSVAASSPSSSFDPSQNAKVKRQPERLLPLHSDVQSASFAPVAITLPIKTQFVPIMPAGSKLTHPNRQRLASPLSQPPSSSSPPQAPANPSHSASRSGTVNVTANVGRGDDDVVSQEVNAEVKPDPMWRPW